MRGAVWQCYSNKQASIANRPSLTRRLGRSCRTGSRSEFQTLCAQFGIEKIDTCQIAAWTSEAGDKAKLDGVFADVEDNGNRRCRRLSRQRRSGALGCGDHGHRPARQFGRQPWQPIELTIRPLVFDPHVLAFNIAGILQTLVKCAQTIRVRVRRCGVEEPDYRHRRLLRAHRQRPRRRRCAAEQRDELAPSYLINCIFGIFGARYFWRTSFNTRGVPLGHCGTGSYPHSSQDQQKKPRQERRGLEGWRF